MAADPRILVCADPAAAAAERLVAAAREGAQIALAGGSTPRAAYERAAAVGGDWSRATLWFSDDRCVPPDHEHSNYGMAKRALLDRLPGPVPDVRRIEGERGPFEAAEDYERSLRDAFAEGVPQLDLSLLGLGPDGHTASLFPNHETLGERERLVVGVETPGMAPFVARVTMTLPVLCAARETVFTVAGEDKAEAVRRAFAGPEDPGTPASLVRPEGGTVTVLVDAVAAGELPAGAAEREEEGR